MYLLKAAFALAFAGLISAKDTDPDWTLAEIGQLKGILRDFMDEDIDRAPGMLRLPFHDCVGNCDGALNMGNAANGGLEDTFADINPLYEGNNEINGKPISRADFYFLAGVVAVEKTIDFNNEICDLGTDPECVPMKQAQFKITLGRKDHPDSPVTDDMHEFPAGFSDHTFLMETMLKTFGFNARETVAILGAHTLGTMTRAGSGFHGDWILGGQQKYMFDNRYYKVLVDSEFNWDHFDAVVDYPDGKSADASVNESADFEDDARDPDERFQWRGIKDGSLKANMLDADVSLVKFIDVVDEGGMSACDFESCPLSPTYSIAQEYAADQDLWLGDFICAFQKMTTTVTDDVELFEPSGDPETGNFISCTQ